MNNAIKKKLNQSFILQQDEADCGVACLSSLIKYYDGHSTLDHLRRLSGTSITGTTLLGLQSAAQQCGFDADGCEADMNALREHGEPVILHVIIDGKLQHYVVCYGTAGDKFIVGDPAKGIVFLTTEELDKMWVSKTCLTLQPNASFKKETDVKIEKRKWFFSLIKKDISILSIAAGIGVAVVLLGLAMAVFSQRLIDDILPKRNYTKLYVGVALVFLMLLAKEGLSVLRQYFLLWQSKEFNIRIVDHFYSKLLSLPKPFFDTRKIGDLTARLDDTARIQRVIGQLAGNLVIDVLVTVVTLGYLFVYSWKVALFCMAVLPFYFLVVKGFNKSIIDGLRTIMTSQATAQANYISTLKGIQSIKSNDKVEQFSNINKSLSEHLQNSILDLGRSQNRLSFIAKVFGVVFIISILWYTSRQVLANNLKIGELTAILGLCASLLPSVANLALIAIPISEAKIAFDRMFELTAARTEDPSGELLHTFETLSLENISFGFTGRPLLFKNISFSIPKGKIMAILGENGRGKSTITEILQKHYSPEAGNILVNGQYRLGDISISSWRKIVGVVPQDVHIFNSTVLENIAFDDAANNPQAVLAFINNFGFAPYINCLPNSYMTLLGEEGINLSGGQRQMLALMRALYHGPQLLLLDECTSAMSTDAEQFVLQLLKKLKTTMAIIFITHKVHLLKNFADEILILDKDMSSKHT
jgi:ATP-binding cassette subfamily B protein